MWFETCALEIVIDWTAKPLSKCTCPVSIVLLGKYIAPFEDFVCSLLKLLLKFHMVSFYLIVFLSLEKSSPSNGNCISVGFTYFFFLKLHNTSVLIYLIAFV